MKKSGKKKLNNKNRHENGGHIYLSLFWEFLKIGLFTIGGGLAMIPQLQHVVVNEKHWLEDEEMLDCIAVSQALPGIVAINMATYVGMKLRGIRGAVAATVGVVMPSLVIIMLVVTVLEGINDNRYVQGAFTGIKAAVCGLILVTVVRTGKKILSSWFAWVLAAGSFIVIIGFGVNAVWAILAGAAFGIIYNAVRAGKSSGKAETKTKSHINSMKNNVEDENSVSEKSDDGEVER